MSYIHGNVASEQCLALDRPEGQFGTCAQDLNILTQMTSIQTEMSSITFDKFGAVYEKGDAFVTGPELQTGLGPWKEAMTCYRVIAKHLLDVAHEEAGPDVKESEAFTEVPKLFEHLMALYLENEPKENQFRLANRDFGAHNLLVDRDFNIVGLIDFDGTLAALLAVVLNSQC